VTAALVGGAVVLALAAGPALARLGLRIAAGYRVRVSEGRPPEPGVGRVVAVTAVLAALLVGAVLLVGARPFLLALVWTAGAGVVLAQVDLAVHRLPDRVVFPSIAVVAVAALLDAAVTASWDQLLRALAAGLAAFVCAALVGLVSPRGLGFGDVKLLGLLGVLLGWFGWPVLLLGVLLGFVVGALVSLALLAARRAGWRTEIAFGPSLLAGAALALGLPALLPGA
jgi:leader peptidase (prepilin peptidase) / N-methyltransferase